MHIAIRYLTTFTYDTHVSESNNALRACPAENGSQRLLRYAVQVDPEAARKFHYESVERVFAPLCVFTACSMASE